MKDIKKIFLSADIEGINGIVNWDETETDSPRYNEFKKEMQREVNAVCKGALQAGVKEILIKDAHDSARNLDIFDLPKETKLHRGWEGGICSMMAGLTRDFDCVLFVGYHSPSRSDGNSLSHTMNTTKVFQITINGMIASEFYINALYASYLNIPIAFLSGDENLTKQVKSINENIEVVASKTGCHAAVVSKHPLITEAELLEGAQKAIENCSDKNIVEMPKHFDIKIQYRNANIAYNASFFPGAKLVDTDTVAFEADDYYDVLVMFKYLL